MNVPRKCAHPSTCRIHGPERPEDEQSEPKPGEVWRSVLGVEVRIRRVWTTRATYRVRAAHVAAAHPPGTRMVEVKGRRQGRSGGSLRYFTVAEFVRNWATVRAA